MARKLYYIETENRHNQILFFTSKSAAIEWASKATRWTPADISANIQTVTPDWLHRYNVFPGIHKNQWTKEAV